MVEDGDNYRVVIPVYGKCITISKEDSVELKDKKDKSVIEVTSDINWSNIQLGKELDIGKELSEFKGVVIKELPNSTYVLQNDNYERVTVHRLIKEIILGDVLDIQFMNIDGLEYPVVLNYRILEGTEEG